VCDLDEYKVKKVTGPSGNMRYTGSGDVHYRNFAGCCYDDQSVGEWVVVKVDKENWAAAPLMIQYRTSPNKINGAWCTWCQKGAVSYIDGCAVKFHDDQASAGFGGYNIDPYPAYAALNGKKLSGNQWKRTKNMRVRAHNSGFEAVLNDGTQIRCAKASIYINVPKKYTGKIAGLAGTGLGGNSDWACGPNKKACGECKEGKLLSAMKGQCPRHYVYSQPNHPLNGNRLTKPLVRWFKSWQVDGSFIPSVFYYQKPRGAGSFNRITGEKIKPPTDTNKRPTGKKAKAVAKCKDFRGSKKAREKCVFDYMMFGDKSLKATKKDRMKQRQASIKTPTARSVRDLSKYRNDAMWSSGVTWGCVGNFLTMQSKLSTEKPPKIVVPKVGSWIENKARMWNPEGTDPLFGGPATDKKKRYQVPLKECQDRCSSIANCTGISRYVNDAQGGNCWGWTNGSATRVAGHHISYTIDRDGNLTKALLAAQSKTFDSDAINGSVVRIDIRDLDLKGGKNLGKSAAAGERPLNLAEIAVYDADGGDIEVKEVIMSSQLLPTTGAMKCVDGNPATFCSTKAGNHTWIKLILGKDHRVAKVTLLPRANCDKDGSTVTKNAKADCRSIANAVITVLHDDKVWWESPPIQGGQVRNLYELITKPVLKPGSIVAFKGGKNNKWCTDSGKKKSILCKSSRLSDWQKFKVVDAGQGQVAFLGGKHHHKYFCGPEAKKNEWQCHFKKVQAFRALDLGKNSMVLKRTGVDGKADKFCSETGTGTGCGKKTFDADSEFSVECVENCPPAAEDDTGKIPLGSFYLKNAEFGRCLHPMSTDPDTPLKKSDVDTPLTFNSGCDGKRLQFKVVAGKKGYFLQHLETGKCIQPMNGEADANGISLVLNEGCDRSRFLFNIKPAGKGLFYLQNKEYERCVRPKGGSAAADNVLSVFDEKCTGKALKFILEPHKDEEVQYTIFPLPGDAKTWAILGKNKHFSKQADRGDFRQIKSRQKTGLQCIESKMQGSKVLAVAAKCRSKKDPQAQGFVYDRFTGGHLRDNKKRCLTRHGSTVAMEKCSNDEKQKWKYKCSAWVNGDAKEGRVLQLSGNKITAAQWTGKKPQLWDFKQVASHNKCGNKRFKIFDFDGSDRSGVRSRNFLGMPSTEVTVALWLKGTKGTVFSYASKMQTKSFVIHLTAFNKLVVYIRGQKFETDKKITAGKWTHIAVAWRNSGKLTVYKDGIKIFEKRDAARKERITAGGCLMLGQAQSTYCDKLDETKAFIGQVADLQVWRGRLNPFAVREIMYKPVPKKVLKGVGKLTAPEAGKRMRLGYISRQYGEQELKKKFPPVCDLDEYKVKKVTGPSGNMRYTGSGDVHYRNFAGCCYDDQSVGEWVVVKVDKENWAAAPLMIQYRTSPNKINGAWCTWCQKGAVSYIDGCAVKFHDDQASAGFGGYNIDPYPAYAALNGKKLSGNQWKRTKNMRVRAHNSGFEAVLNDGTQIRCAKASIYINVPKKYTGKIAGLAGTGLGGNSDWACGPNKKACGECKEGKLLSAMKGQCPRHYVYSQPNHPLNGNRLTKPLVRWFKSWQVDGSFIPSVFYYQKPRGAGSFNRITGQKIQPPSDTNKRPTGKKAKANAKCKDFRENKKAREKCVFDYMMFGDKALKATKKDRMKQRQANIKSPTALSVRDISKYRNDGEWIGRPRWGCSGDFLKMQGSAPKRVLSTKSGKSKPPELHVNHPILVTKGQWIQSTTKYVLPVFFKAQIRAVGIPGTIFVSLFNKDGKKDGGLTMESGGGKGAVKVFQKKHVGKPFELKKNTVWHEVAIDVDSDGIVKYFLNKKLMHKDTTKLKKGTIALIAGSADMQIRNVEMRQLASTDEKEKRKCFAIAAKDPQDGGNIHMKPACPKFTCTPTVCICKCPGEQCIA